MFAEPSKKFNKLVHQLFTHVAYIRALRRVTWLVLVNFRKFLSILHS